MIRAGHRATALIAGVLRWGSYLSATLLLAGLIWALLALELPLSDSSANASSTTRRGQSLRGDATRDSLAAADAAAAHRNRSRVVPRGERATLHPSRPGGVDYHLGERAAGAQSLAGDALDAGADAAELLLNSLITAINVIDAVNYRFFRSH